MSDERRYAWRILSEVISIAAVGSGAEDVLSERVPENEEVLITHLAFEDLDNTMTDAKMFIAGRGPNLFLREWDTISAATIYTDMFHPIALARGEQIGIKTTGSTAADRIRLYLRGRKRFVE